MNPEELDKQFEAVDFDKSGNVIPPGSPPAAARKKRVTVADLMKLVNELEELINTDIFNWMEKLDTRTNHLETLSNEMHPDFPKGVTSRLDKIESVGLENLPSFISDSTERFQKLEYAVGAMADIMQTQIHEAESQQPAAAQEIEFAKPPEQESEPSVHISDLEHIASVCLNMNDVLMICRALRDVKCIYDSEREYILNLATRNAGVQMTSGLRIRAGIKQEAN